MYGPFFTPPPVGVDRADKFRSGDADMAPPELGKRKLSSDSMGAPEADLRKSKSRSVNPYASSKSKLTLPLPARD